MSTSPFPLTNLFSVDNLVAVITGGGSGIGQAVATALDANGAKAVYILGRRASVLESAAASAQNKSLIPLVCDVTSKDSLAAAAAHVRDKHGYIDTLFANSGIVGVEATKLLPSGRKPSVKEFQDAMWTPGMDEFTEAFHINVTGMFYTALAFLDLLDAGNVRGVAPQRSSIVVTGSVAGQARALSAGFAYSASKAGVLHLSKVLATYFVDYGIRVDVVAPGIFVTDMTRERAYLQGEATKEGSVDPAQIPFGRAGTMEEVAGAVLFLMGKTGGYVTGNVVVSDGGRLSVQPGG